MAARATGPIRLVAVDGADHNDTSLLSGEQLIDAVAELANRAA